MAPQEPPVSFDEIIEAGRQKRKHEALAKEIFSKGRRASAPAGGVGNRRTASTPSLASRVGIAKLLTRTLIRLKRSTPTPKPKANVNGQWIHDLHALNNPQASRLSQLPSRSRPARINRDNKLHSALQSESMSNGISDDINIRGTSIGLSIRGAAGPFTVVASNFAPGTTASDIEAVIAPFGGEVVSCRLITASPTVIAEVVFADKAGADNMIAMFNNQRADGRLLHVYLKPGPPAPPARDIKMVPSGLGLRPQKELLHRERPRAEPDIQDGRYGFDDAMDEGSLYSDDMLTRGRRY